LPGKKLTGHLLRQFAWFFYLGADGRNVKRLHGKRDLQTGNAIETGIFAAKVKDGARARVVCEQEGRDGVL
jgi:hypothetical protein